jgi:CRISPR-associated protein Csm4
MATLMTFQLSFASGLHLGTRGVNLEEHGVHVPSDTLFSALVDAWRRLGGDPQAFVQPFVDGAPPFLLSSVFPFAGQVRFYPMPVELERVLSSKVLGSQGKASKRIQYLSETLWRRALAGEMLDDWLFSADEFDDRQTAGVALQSGVLWLTVDETAGLPEAMRLVGKEQKRPLHALRHLPVWGSQRVPRVTVDRISSASTIYHTGRTSFAQSCGLWFGVAWQDPAATVVGDGRSYREALALALDALQHDGLGGERSVGYGAFTCTNGAAVTLPAPAAGQAAWLLSRYHPREAELATALGEGATYRLVSVAGWLRTPDGPAQRRKRLTMLAEGSIVCPSAYPAGDVSDVKPTYTNPAGDTPHAVYRYGLALAAGLGKAGANHG